MAQRWRDRSEASKQRHVERTREYLTEHPEVREKIRIAQRKRYAEDAEYRRLMIERRTRHRTEKPMSMAWYAYRAQAEKRGYEFSLERRHFEDLVSDNCFYCGAVPNRINGVDRVDNTRGYIMANVVTCCKKCNDSKRARTRSDFESWACRIADNVRKSA